jgi:hypothetical protein
MTILTFDEKKMKQVKAGELVDGVFTKEVLSKKHLIKIYNGYAIQLDVVSKLQGGCKKIIIVADKKVHYEIDFDTFMRKALKINLGHGYQYCIQCKSMKEFNPDQQEFICTR